MKKIRFIKEVGRDAHIDWIIILVLTATTVVSLAMVSFSLYNAVVKGNIQGNSPVQVVASTKFKEAVVSSVVSDLGVRAQKTKEAQAGYTGLGNPSI